MPDILNRLRTALRMIAHWTTGGMLASLGNYKLLMYWASVYIWCQAMTLIVDFISPPSWNKK